MLKKTQLKFSYNKPPIIIAEISGNHNGNKLRFLKLIEKACQNGADIIKIQTYEAEDLTIKSKDKKFIISDGVWKGKNLYNLYKKASTPYNWHLEAFNIAKKYRKIIFSTPFSIRAVDFLENLKVPIYKIASFEITDLRLIEYIAQKKKPIIISTGLSSLKEVEIAIRVIEKYHKKIIILHCVSNYPTKTAEANLKRINFLKEKFNKYKIGLSDHTNDIYTSIAATSIGVCVIEKHFNIDNKKTPDSSFSINPTKLRELKTLSEDIHYSIHNKTKLKSNQKNIKFRRSIFASVDIKKNEKLSLDNTINLRPLIGIKSEKLFNVLGKRTKKDIKKDSPIFFSDLK